MLKKIVCSLFILNILFSLSAAGKKDNEEKSASDLKSWQETFDISERKSGKYNIMITATDQGGNQTIAGPYNIYIDPESDLPITNITNPSIDMRVPGNLNIVGTCIDDDAVDYVEIILDDDIDNPVRAEGKEFWSYFLDTSNLQEGPHKVSVYGVDIHGVKGHEDTSIWHLDRQEPITQVTNLGMGVLISGKIELSGEISDGNGIRSLSYSTDNGTTFTEISIKYNKSLNIWTFSLPIDTRKVSDGASVCWFKAIDAQGTVGLYSFLYFIDNTKPSVRIIYPHLDESVNGVFSVAGYATDIIGVKSLSWQFGNETGELEVVAGNPYWVQEFDLRGVNASNRDFIIKATDTVGNVTSIKQKIPIDQSKDLPVINLLSPTKDQIVESILTIQGIATDDDGIEKITYSIDNVSETEVTTDGVFHIEIPTGTSSSYAAGKHVLSISAYDIYGVKSKDISIPFVIAGDPPTFDAAATIEANVDNNMQSFQYTTGIDIHPESNPVFKGTIHSGYGISEISWTFNGVKAGKQSFNNSKGNVQFSIPLKEMPWGVVEMIITATDAYQRKVEKRTLLHFTDLSSTRGSPAVVFTDSQISSENIVSLDASVPVSGYFVGGKAVKVEIVPNVSNAVASLTNGNSIRISPVSDRSETSDYAVVRVTTDRGVTYDSQKLRFRTTSKPPVIEFSRRGILDGNSNVTISGTSVSSSQITYAGYRIIPTTAPVFIDASGTVTGSVQSKIELPSFNPLPIDSSRGNFSLELSSYDIQTGISIVEFTFTNADGGKSSDAIFVRKIPDLPYSDDAAKPLTPARPVISWVQGENVYYTSIYQGYLSLDSVTAGLDQVYSDVSAEAGIIHQASLLGGTTQCEVKLTDALGKPYSSRFTANKPFSLSAKFVSVRSIPYSSGMEIVVAPKGQQSDKPTLLISIDTASTINSVSYSFNGGPQSRVTAKKAETGVGYTAEIPLDGLKAELTTIEVVVDAQKAESVTLKGTLSIIRDRPSAGVFEDKVICWELAPVDEYIVDNYIVTDEISVEPVFTFGVNETIDGYYNVGTPCIISLDTINSGFSLSSVANHLVLTGKKEGVFKHMVIKVRDPENIEFNSQPFTVIIDSASPTLEITSPLNMQWVQNEIAFKGRVSDGNGVRAVEYSFDNGITWEPLKYTPTTDSTAEIQSYSFDDVINISTRNEGLLPVSVRVLDGAGKQTVQKFVVQKDTTPPDVTVIVPTYGAVINGETRIGVIPHDNGKLDAGWYRISLADTKMTADEIQSAFNAGEFPPYLSAPEFLDAKAKDSEENVPCVQYPLELKSIVTTVVGTIAQPLLDQMQLVFRDKAGNEGAFSLWDFKIDAESDKPVIEIHLPSENQIVQRDFVISGVVYDDDGASRVWYKFDDAEEYISLGDYGTSFSIPATLANFSDNEHTISVYAEDIHGIKGDIVVRTFRVSLAEPTGAVQTPTIDETVKGSAIISGIASDKNGIAKVQVSLDNGNSFNDAVGSYSEDNPDEYTWSYVVDTRVIQDGTHVIFIKVYDNYNVEGLYSSLINIDNTVPSLNLELPLDGTKTTAMLFFSGQTTDNIGLTKLYANIRNLDTREQSVPDNLAKIEFEPAEILTQAIDISALQDGFYNVEIIGEDFGGNISRVSRNIQVDKSVEATRISLLYPLNGEHVQGLFNLYGFVESETPVKELVLYIDDVESGVTQISESNYFKFIIAPDMITTGDHKIEVRGIQDSGQKVIVSNTQNITYSARGPWISIDNLTMGDFAIDRPYLEGSCGYSFTEDELIRSRSRETPKDEREALLNQSVDRVEISFDNGKSFKRIGTTRKWRYRIENTELAEGYHFLIVRAIMKNGEIAVTRSIIQIDKTAPSIKLISPSEGGSFNETLVFAGLAADDVKLDSVTMTLRSGDKASYEIPSFIQGLYLDWHFWGASLYDIGIGLTFFDDNVKIQFQYGQMTQSQFTSLQLAFGSENSKMRYGGHIVGLKLLANIGYVPFRYFFGPNWEWLSASFALGANFSLFTETQSGNPQILSAFIGQIEFPRVTIPKQKYFKTFSFYTELQLWFIPTDVESKNGIVESLRFQPSAGIRMSVF